MTFSVSYEDVVSRFTAGRVFFVHRVEPRFREEYDAERPTASSGYVAYAGLHDRGFPGVGCARRAQETHRQKKEREPGYSADQELSPETY